jgi:hypothetical protein
MMFGALGHADHGDSIRIIHRALDNPPAVVQPALRRRPAGERTAA